MTFPGRIKGHANTLSLSSSLILAAEQTNINMRRAHPIFEPLFSWEDHSFIIYSFLLDQLVFETSSWMLYSCSNICNCFLPFVQLTVQGFSLKLTLKFLELINILIYSFVLLFLTEQSKKPTICLCYIFFMCICSSSLRKTNFLELLVWFGLVWFYNISTILDYLMPNPFLYI